MHVHVSFKCTDGELAVRVRCVPVFSRDDRGPRGEGIPPGLDIFRVPTYGSENTGYCQQCEYPFHSKNQQEVQDLGKFSSDKHIKNRDIDNIMNDHRTW